MKTRDQEYRELFMAEALEYYDSMSRHLSELERNPDAGPALNELFRLMHNLKANARAMGFTDLGEEPVLDEEEPIDTEEESNRKMELSDLVYIQVKKLDNLLNLVGELAIDRDRIMTLAQELDNPALLATAQHLFRISDDLQYSVMDARLVGVGVLLNKFPRVVRDVASAEDKQVELTMTGQDVQIDRNILQIITDALLHLVRNAVSHGLETTEQRLKAGKPAVGHLTLSALTERDDVLIQVRDDGR